MEEFTKEYVSMFQRWSDFKGKSNVREFWMPVLINIIVAAILGALGRIANIFNIVDYIYGLAIIIPFLALFDRRMHDIGKRGWNILWILLPIPGWIILIIYTIRPSK